MAVAGYVRGVDAVAIGGRPVSRRRHSAAYRAHIASPEWRAIRKMALARARHRCQLCRSTWRLAVHHNGYDHLGNEPPEDLIVLCGKCHAFADLRRRAHVRRWHWQKQKTRRRRRRRSRVAQPFRDVLTAVMILGVLFVGLHIAALVLTP